MPEAYIYDHVRTPRGRGKADGSLHEVTALALATVPLRALKLKRRGLGVELKPEYWRDAVWYMKRAEAEAAIPSLFDLDEPDQANDVAAE